METKCALETSLDFQRTTRRYNPEDRTLHFDSYLSTGFTQDGDVPSAHAVCILHNEVLPNSAMAPFKLKHRFETERSEHEGKPLRFFQCVLNNLSPVRTYKKTRGF
jgi:hypothetical protein